jgi:hypothetical protein
MKGSFIMLSVTKDPFIAPDVVSGLTSSSVEVVDSLRRSVE